MRFYLSTAALLIAAGAGVGAAEETASTSTTQVPACTATASSGSGAFFDLRPDRAEVEDPEKPKPLVTHDYHAKGHDYGSNFTMNICGAVVDPVSNVVGLDKTEWANVSAFYTVDDVVYSIGSESVKLRSRGRKLVLQYINGSPCARKKKKSSKVKRLEYKKEDDEVELPPSKGGSDEDEDEDEDDEDDSGSTLRRKSTTISFICDRDPSVSQASISFVGTDPDECSYFFEARSSHACAHAEPHKPGSVGPGSIFGLILVIAFLVYAIGGVCYNRTVTHARGWRQLPNYSLWAGLWSLVSDMVIIGASSCARLFPGSGGRYSQLNSGYSSRNRNSDAENRLIDQLDEEWDD